MKKFPSSHLRITPPSAAELIRAHGRFLLILSILVLVWAGCMAVIVRQGGAHLAATEASTHKNISDLESKINEVKANRQLLGKLEGEKEAAEKAVEHERASDDSGRTGNTASQPAAAPKTCASPGPHTNPAVIDVVVNKRHCLQPLDFVPSDLATSNGATLSSKAISSFNKLFAAAAAAGQPINVSSSYRSYDTQ